MRLIPKGRREWAALTLRLGVVAVLLISATLFMISMPGRSYSGPFQPLSPDELSIRDRLKEHTAMLAGTIGERNIRRYDALVASANYIKDTLNAEGLRVNEQQFTVGDKVFKNIEVEVGGDTLPEQILIVGAHYDSAVGSPGANDNATGVAALLELARLLKTEALHRKVRLVAFVNEEPPYFQTESMGSRVYAKRSSGNKENIIAMISVETIACYSDEPDSQLYPFGFSLLYPSTGNFLAFIGNLASRGLVRKSIRLFRDSTTFPSEGASVPGWLTGVGWSDHWSFWEEGIAAMMVTDTALFRYRQYHTSADTPEKISYDHMSRVVSGLRAVVVGLANSNE